MKLHALFAGKEPQLNVNVPPAPSGVNVRLKVAVCPLATVWLGEGATTVKSKPVPESATVILAARALLAAVSEPLTAPVVGGTKTTATVQLAPTANCAVQVVD